jgi:anti-sigma-K factor RskA
MDAIWLSFPVGSLIAVALAWLAYRFVAWRPQSPLVAAFADAEARPEPAFAAEPR